MKYNYIDQSLVCVAHSIDMIHENTLLKSGFFQSAHITSIGFRNDYNVGAAIMNKGSISFVLNSDNYVCLEKIKTINQLG